MSTTLEVILKTAGFNEGATAIKKVGDEATNTNNKLKTTTSTVDQVSKSTTSLGSKLANAGKQFSGTITNVAALGSTVVNLSRQYQDLTDSQIRVDRTQLKMSRTAEAVTKAQGALNALVSKGVKSGAAYEKALLDLQQAQDASTLAITMNKEALEDQQRTYENFAMSVAPTILTAGSSITSMFKEMGGEKGMGGFASKLKSLPGMSKMSMTSIAASIGLVTAAAGFALVGIQKIFDLMEQKKALMADMAKITGGTATPADLQKAIDDANKNKNDWATQLADFMRGGPLGKAIFGPTTKEIEDQLIKEWTSLKSRIESQNLMKGLMTTVMGPKADPTMNNEVKNRIIDQIKNILAIFSNKNNWDTTKYGAIEAVRANTVKILTEAMTNLQADVTLAHVINQIPAGLTGALRDAFLKQNPFAGLMGETLKQAMTMSAGGGISGGSDVIGEAMKKALTPTKLLSSEIATLTAESLKNASTSDIQKASTDALSKAEAGLAQHTKDLAAAKVAAAQAARDLATAGDNELSGINKIIAAYEQLEPKVTQVGKGHVTKGVQKLPIQQAQDALKTFMQGLAPTLTTGSAEAFASKWIETAAKKIGGGASMILKPLLDYITQHKNDAPGVFASGLVDVIGSLDLTKNMQKVFLPATTASAAAAKDASANLGKIDTAPAVAKVKTVQVALNKILPQYKTTVTVVDKATQPINKIKNALSSIPKLTTATIKIIPKYLGTPLGNQLISGNLKINQHGYQGTVKRPTTFVAGEGGRHEDVRITPRGSVQRGGSGGGGGSTHITISFEPQEFAQFIRYRINDNQGVVK